MIEKSQETVFFQLLRLGVGTTNVVPDVDCIDWNNMEALVMQQGLTSIILDGLECLSEAVRPPKEVLLRWIGNATREEAIYEKQQKEAVEMANLFYENNIRTFVLKGIIVAECYPKPYHRYSSDLDCFLLSSKGVFDAWKKGNDLIKEKGYVVDESFYKNSVFNLPGLVVENHRFLTPFRGNSTLRNLEIVLQRMLQEDMGEDRISGTYLYRPPVMVSALFLIEHAYSHFLHEGLTWKMVLDWMMFKKRHWDDIDKKTLNNMIDEFGFRRFYDSYLQLGMYLVGEIAAEDLSYNDRMMLSDVWAQLNMPERWHGLKAKFYMAVRTWKARWKYKCFADISWIEALWIQVKGYMFIHNPSLSI